MRTIPISIGVLLISTAAFAAEQSSAKPNPKLVEMFAAKDEKGKPIITPEQQEYFNGLNDNLKELLNRAVEKETITRPEHLSILLSLQLRPQKWSWSCKTIAFFATAIRPTNRRTNFFLSHPMPARRRRT